ncbi:MAG: signal peptidase II [Lachnospiraceae bacterium]
MRDKTKKRLYYAISIIAFLVLIGLDQFTKYLAVTNLKGRPAISVIKDVLEWSYLENRGAAFGILMDKQFLFVILTSIFCIAIIVIFCLLPKIKRFLPLHIIAVILLSGAVGNFMDRLRLGYVVDFIYFVPIDFPIFNVADCYVTVSTALLAFFILFYYKDSDFKFLKDVISKHESKADKD